MRDFLRTTITVTAVVATFELCAEEPAPLEKFIRRDVPDAVLEDRFLPRKTEFSVRRTLEAREVREKQFEKLVIEHFRFRRAQDGIFILEPKGTQAEEEARVTRLLAKKALIKIAETTLEEAVDFIRRTTDIEIDYDASVNDEDKKWVVKHDAHIENDETVGDVLSRIGAYADLKWKLLDGRVVFGQNTQVKDGKEVKKSQ